MIPAPAQKNCKNKIPLCFNLQAQIPIINAENSNNEKPINSNPTLNATSRE